VYIYIYYNAEYTLCIYMCKYRYYTSIYITIFRLNIKRVCVYIYMLQFRIYFMYVYMCKYTYHIYITIFRLKIKGCIYIYIYIKIQNTLYV